jgi:hypothetical protein
LAHGVSPLQEQSIMEKSNELAPATGITSGRRGFGWGLATAAALMAAGLIGYGWGQASRTEASFALPPELLKASATHGGANMAIATGPIDDESEGIFFLDFLTGDLQCWVFYPKTGTFGAKFATNVTQQIGGGKNAEYLMVTGSAVGGAAATNARPAKSLLYVVNVQEGLCAAYGLLWNQSLERSGQAQVGALVPMGRDQVRAPFSGNK